MLEGPQILNRWRVPQEFRESRSTFPRIGYEQSFPSEESSTCFIRKGVCHDNMTRAKPLPVGIIGAFLVLVGLGFSGLSVVNASPPQNVSSGGSGAQWVGANDQSCSGNYSPANLSARAACLAYASPLFQSLVQGQATRYNGYNISFTIAPNGTRIDQELGLTFDVGDHQVGVTENLNATQIIGVFVIPNLADELGVGYHDFWPLLLAGFLAALPLKYLLSS
jgi:hypothetical protein